MTKRKRETPEERNGKRVKQRRERVREGERKRGRIVRHEVGQSNVPPTCENLFMHEKAGKASERVRESERETKEWAEMWQNDTAGSTKIKKGRKREQARERTQEREREG